MTCFFLLKHRVVFISEPAARTGRGVDTWVLITRGPKGRRAAGVLMAGARTCWTCVTRAAYFPLSAFKGDFCNNAAQRSILLHLPRYHFPSNSITSARLACSTFTESNIQSGHHSPSRPISELCSDASHEMYFLQSQPENKNTIKAEVNHQVLTPERLVHHIRNIQFLRRLHHQSDCFPRKPKETEKYIFKEKTADVANLTHENSDICSKSF